MTKNDAIEIAAQYVKDNNLTVGNIEEVKRIASHERVPSEMAKGDLWVVMFKIPLPPGVHRDPDVIRVDVEDSTGEATEFYCI